MRAFRAITLLLLLALPAAFAADDRPADSSGEAALFADMPVVEAASLHAQTLAEAPGSVTVVTAADIHRYGYRTLSDVLASVRGFTMLTNHIFSTSEVRGFAAPGDSNTCFLVMINGHPMTEIIAQSDVFFNQDFGLDLDLVDRIEIIRGPSSALYGSNGILATINLITKAPVDAPRLMLSAETGVGEPDKLVLMTSQSLGRGANLLVEGSGILSGGNSLFFPTYDTLDQNHGIATGVDAQSGYHAFANLAWGAWNFSVYVNNWRQRTPVLAQDTRFDDQGQYQRIARDFATAANTHEYSDGGQLRWQVSYDAARYVDRYDYEMQGPGILDNRDYMAGDWITSQLTYSRQLGRVGLLTAGLSGQLDIRDLIENADYIPERVLNLHISHPDRSVAPFVQQEWDLARDWKAYLGARLDDSHDYGAYLSPRLALVYQPDSRSAYKLVYGRPFRAPSAYEAYYQDGITEIANPRLKPETADAVELSAEHKIGKSAYALVDAFDYAMHSVIEEQLLSNGLGQYQNAGNRRSYGVEFEAGGHPAGWFETTASLTLDRARDLDDHIPLPNNPSPVAKLRGAVPVFRGRFYFSAELQYLAARLTVNGISTRPVALVNTTLSTNRLWRGFDLVAGMRNALNWGYSDPVTWPLENTPDQIPALGRTAFIKLSWRPGE